jgi:hypothetical protein
MNLDQCLRLRSKVKRHRRTARSRRGTYSFSHRCHCDCAKPAKRSIRGRWIIPGPSGATDVPCSRPANSRKRRCEESFAFASHRPARIVAAGHDKISLRGALRTRRRSNAQLEARSDRVPASHCVIRILMIFLVWPYLWYDDCRTPNNNCNRSSFFRNDQHDASMHNYGWLYQDAVNNREACGPAFKGRFHRPR